MPHYRITGARQYEAQERQTWLSALTQFENMTHYAIRGLRGLDTAWGNRMWRDATAVRHDCERLAVGERIILTRPDGRTVSLERID